MKKTLLGMLVVLSMSSLANNGIELEYEDFSMQEPVIRTGAKAAKENIKTTFVYNESDMYRVFTRAGFLTEIRLNPDEEIIYLAGGDTSRWAIDEGVSGSIAGNRKTVVIKPFYAGIKTNLIVNTNKRTYNIFLHSANEWYNPVVEFDYPREAKLAIKKKDMNEESTSFSLNLENLNNDYSWNNPKYKWSPSQVFDDGQKTYIVMKPEMGTSEAPALFIRDEHTGETTLVRYRVRNNYYIVDRLLEQAILKLGKREVLIKRKGSFIKHEKDHFPVKL